MSTQTKSDKKTKLLDKIEEEALLLLAQFKESPIKSILKGLVVIWAIKQIKTFWGN